MLRKATLTLLYVAIPATVFFGTYTLAKRYFFEAADPTNPDKIIVEVGENDPFQAVAQQLKEKSLIRSSLAFRVTAQLQNKDTQIKAGEYEMSPSMSPREILDRMVRGEMFHRRVTVKEGMSLADIMKTLKEAGIIEPLPFQLALEDREFLESQGIESSSFEGYLFPETYYFPRNTSPKKIIAAMHEQLEKRWLPEWTQRAEILELSKHNVLTLASIIEKESGNFDEQPVISSVFHNRLKRNMRLQADPTVIYGIKDFNGNITKRDLTTLTPYNTYMIDGLPPGPIANPGINAIKAALYPADTNYLYFVGNGDGEHIFSESLDQHNNAVNQYQRAGAGANAESHAEIAPDAIPQPSQLEASEVPATRDGAEPIAAQLAEQS